MKKIYLILFFIIIFLSGCISQISEKKAGTIEISISADRTSVPKNSDVGITLGIENKALTTINNIEAYLYGPIDWNLTDPYKGKTQIWPKLRPEDFHEFFWRVKAPNVISDTPYIIFGQVKYDMVVNKTATVTIVTYDYYKRTKTVSSIKPSPTEMGGPISIDFLLIGEEPFVYDTAATTIPIKVVITNSGTGKPYYGTKSDGLNNVSVYLYTSGISLDCNPEVNVGTGKEVTLIKDGKISYVSCDIVVPAGSVTSLATFTLTASITYSYVQDVSSPTITVRAK